MIFEDTYRRFLKLFMEDRNDMYSWMTPEGTIVQLKYYEIHGDYASRTMGGMKGSDAITEMFRRKYFRMTYEGNTLYCHNPFHRPSAKQLHLMKSIAIENDMRVIRWDDEAGDHTLWVRH